MKKPLHKYIEQELLDENYELKLEIKKLKVQNHKLKKKKKELIKLEKLMKK